MRLAELEREVEGFLATSALNLLADPQPLTTAPLGAPLRFYDPGLLGAADARDPLWERLKSPEVIGPRHLLPGEWLPGARSVISFFLPFTRAVRRANRNPEITATEWLYARAEGEALLAAVSQLLAGEVEAEGGRAVVPAVDPRFATVDMRSNWSERHAAFVAGLGTFSLSRSMITRLGSAGRFGSVITDLELEPTPRPYVAVDEYCGKCGACIRRCPCRAISLANGKDNAACKVHVDVTRRIYAPRYGCGKCQTGVACEARIPPRTRKGND